LKGENELHIKLNNICIERKARLDYPTNKSKVDKNYHNYTTTQDNHIYPRFETCHFCCFDVESNTLEPFVFVSEPLNHLLNRFIHNKDPFRNEMSLLK